MPLVSGEAEEIHEDLFFEISFHAAYEPVRAVRTKRWKYIERFDEDWTKPVMANCDAGESKTVWVDQGWAEREVASEELYDLCFDPNETCNLAADKAYADILKELRGKLGQWMRDTDDPLLEGPIEPPVGAKVTDTASPEPGERIRVIGEEV
jgi:arylsulfatase A-like enzyme